MTVLEPVIDQQNNPRQRQTFYEAIEKRLGFAVDPMEVLKDDQQGLPLALTDEHPLYRIEGITTPLLGVHTEVSFRLVDQLSKLRPSRRRMKFVCQRSE